MPPFLLVANYDLIPGHSCREGYIPLTSSWEDCKEAAIALGFSTVVISKDDHENDLGKSRPRGCFFVHGLMFRFNKGAGGNSYSTDRILCKAKRKEQDIIFYLSYPIVVQKELA